MLELGWEGSAKRLAERKHIQKVPLVLLVPEVELDHYIDGNATHHATTDDSVTGQVMGMVSNASNVPSGVVEHIGVNVDPGGDRGPAQPSCVPRYRWSGFARIAFQSAAP